MPIDTALSYRDALVAQGVATETIIGAGIGHAWLAQAPEAISTWFFEH